MKIKYGLYTFKPAKLDKSIFNIYKLTDTVIESKTSQFIDLIIQRFLYLNFLYLLQLQQQYIGNSMNGKRNSFKQTQNVSGDSDDELSSCSDFSVSKTKKSFRKVNKKKITKIIHTYCFMKMTADGKRELYFCQQGGESSLKNPALVKSLAMKQLRQQTGRMIQLAQENAGFTKTQIIEPVIKQKQLVQPSRLHLGQPSSFYLLYS